MKVKVTDVTNPDAKTWFLDKFGEDELEIGMFMQRPTARVSLITMQYHHLQRDQGDAWINV